MTTQDEDFEMLMQKNRELLKMLARKDTPCPHIGSQCLYSRCKYFDVHKYSARESGPDPVYEVPCENWRNAHPDWEEGFKLV